MGPSRTSDSAAPSNRLLVFFSNPVVGIIGSVASVLGVLLAVYFYAQNVTVPELVYFVNPVRTVVVKQGTSSRLQVVFDGQALSHDVTAAQIAIWNRGRRPIRTSEVLQPLMIVTEPRVPILEATLRKKSRDVAGVAIDQARMAQGEVTVSWAILETGDGAVVQLVYAAGPEAQIHCAGIVEGQREIRELKYSGTITAAAEQVHFDKRFTHLFGIFALCLSLVMMIFVFSVGVFRRGLQPPKLIAIPLVLAPLLLLGSSLYLLLIYSIPEPPFGF